MGSQRTLVAVLVVLVVALIAGYYLYYHRSCPSCEGFYWTEWLGGNERENYSQRKRRRSHFENFGAYGTVDPLGGFPDYNPHPEHGCRRARPDYFISGLAGGGPCPARPCGSGTPASAERREPKMSRSTDLYEGFSPDAPGSCPTKDGHAARAEAEALRAAAGF